MEHPCTRISSFAPVWFWFVGCTRFDYRSKTTCIGSCTKNSTFGKLQFLDPVNATLLNLSDAVNISYRSISMDTTNSTIHERLDIPADITFYEVNFTYPVIMRDGLVCPDYVCAFDYYDNSLNLRFNVTGFEFTPSTTYNLSRRFRY